MTIFRYSDDRKRLAIGYADGEVHVYRVEKRGERKASHECLKHMLTKGYDGPTVFTAHRTGVNSLAFSHDGLTLASGGKDSVVALFDLLAETSLFRFLGHQDQ